MSVDIFYPVSKIFMDSKMLIIQVLPDALLSLCFQCLNKTNRGLGSIFQFVYSPY